MSEEEEVSLISASAWGRAKQFSAAHKVSCCIGMGCLVVLIFSASYLTGEVRTVFSSTREYEDDYTSSDEPYAGDHLSPENAESFESQVKTSGGASGKTP